jgi:hypothetical protein
MSGLAATVHQIQPGHPTSPADQRSETLKPGAGAGLWLIHLVIASEAPKRSNPALASGSSQ